VNGPPLVEVLDMVQSRIGQTIERAVVSCGMDRVDVGEGTWPGPNWDETKAGWVGCEAVGEVVEEKCGRYGQD
jgi:hypothetical protein